jgi:hypothetical protein
MSYSALNFQIGKGVFVISNLSVILTYKWILVKNLKAYNSYLDSKIIKNPRKNKY